MNKLFPNVSLQDKTTFRIGGPALWYTEPSNVEDIKNAIRFARENGLPVITLGKGSNLLVSDKGWPGVAINCESAFSAKQWRGAEVVAQAGVMLDTVVRESIERGFSGLEELSGIPGTLGGAVVMNAGAFSMCIADRFVSADVLEPGELSVKTLFQGDMRFGYRTSLLQEMHAIVLTVTLKFENGNESALRIARKEILEKRRAKQPLDLPNCGSVFKRPPGSYAGALIEQAGLKGFRYGNVSISSKHANFIVNHGNGTAVEVRHLMVIAQKKVYEQSGILLEPEVIFIGSFEEPLFDPGSP
jgi:UDP-N-acetylmuramate dehydrogenase